MPDILAVGVDLAVDPIDTGLCVIERADAGAIAVFDRSKRSDEGLAAVIDSVAEVGASVAIDVPLGWPRAFHEFMNASDPVGVISRYRADEKPRFRRLRYRATDVELRDRFRSSAVGHRMYPLSVSTDKLGAATMRWFAIRAFLRCGTAHVIETYPAAARRVWGIRPPVRPGEFGLKALAVLDHRGRPTARSLNGHENDALIAALVAAAHPEATEPIGDDPGHEGVIHLPLPGSTPRV